MYVEGHTGNSMPTRELITMNKGETDMSSGM